MGRDISTVIECSRLCSGDPRLDVGREGCYGSEQGCKKGAESHITW